MTEKQVFRYNELLLKYLQDEEFQELLTLVNNYYISTKIINKKNGDDYISNPFERLIYDLENREELIKGGIK